MWNTGCNVIYNQTSTPILIVDQEDPQRRLLVPANGGSATFHGTIFPWCNRLDEVKGAPNVPAKAFVFYKGPSVQSPKAFYMFQDYDNNVVDWIAADGKEVWDLRKSGGANPSSYLDVVVGANGTNYVPQTIRVW